MAWTTPILVEICIGLEINGYLPAEFWSFWHSDRFGLTRESSDSGKDRRLMGRLSAFILGSAAGGGFPQWNCNCDVCRLAWACDPRVKPRTQASLAVTSDGRRWTLV